MLQKRQFISFFIKRNIFWENGIAVITTWTCHQYLKSSKTFEINTNCTQTEKLEGFVILILVRLWDDQSFSLCFIQLRTALSTQQWSCTQQDNQQNKSALDISPSAIRRRDQPSEKMMRWFHWDDSNAQDYKPLLILPFINVFIIKTFQIPSLNLVLQRQ